MFAKVQKRLYDCSQIDFKNLLFTNKALFSLLIPLIIEQLLNSLMGMVDTVMVTRVSATAVSAVALVDSVNNLVVQVFAAMAAGAVIICSQYLGSHDRKASNQAAEQVVMTVLAISMGLTLIGLVFRRPLLRLIFGQVEKEVMSSCMSYFQITVLSYPFLALFNAGGAFFRAGGNSRFPMIISVISNGMNIAGNAVFIFVFHWGVVGAALSTLIARIFCMVVIFYFLRKPKQDIIITGYHRFRPDVTVITKILAISVPSGIENGMFQFGKLAIQSTVSTMGTAAIAAQAMAAIMENVNGVVGVGIGIGLMTVVGQCIGAGRREEAKYYVVKMIGFTEIGLLVACTLVYLITGPVTRLSGMEPEVAKLCLQMVLAITIAKPILWPLSFTTPYGMRAAGDVKFSMLVSTASMWFCRVALCIFLVKHFHMGPMAVWIGMFADWFVRGVIFTGRFLSGKWLRKNVI